jgi:2'-5' RNA ligase
MAFALAVPIQWASQGWKVKIRDDERNEVPHATFLRKREAWRMSLRTGAFLDADPDPSDVPRDLAEHVWSKRHALRRSWNTMYPENPVFSQESQP